MYADPSLVREHVVKLSFNDREAELINAAALKAGLPVAAYSREAIMRGLAELARKHMASSL